MSQDEKTDPIVTDEREPSSPSVPQKPEIRIGSLFACLFGKVNPSEECAREPNRAIKLDQIPPGQTERSWFLN
jgi:hypothetical protein